MKFVGWFCYYAARVITWVLAHGLWGARITGTENIPATGAFLLCPVHRSNVDGPLTCILTRRRMRYLAKETMFDIGWLGNVYKAMGAIPVNRGTPDRQSLQACTEALESGYPLVLFPEGTRKEGPVVEEIHEGAAYIALKAGVPVVPVGIGGSAAAHPKGSKMVRRAKIDIVIGELIRLPAPEGRVPRNAIREGTEIIKGELQRLFDEAEGRVTS